ncbi:hypothetical protein OIU76_002672 [Salix suchowensis]|nr:hypothetical protein OIU76_002672 [Salix suchowensis]
MQNTEREWHNWWDTKRVRKFVKFDQLRFGK